MTHAPAVGCIDLDLAITGPGFTAALLLRAGQPEALIGRDADCDACLPDPNRNVSRHHLAVRNVQGTVHFQVLSTVNGVRVLAGEVPPGGSGVLAPGDVMRLADYEIEVRPARSAALADDPWSQLETQAASLELAPGTAQDDPFGDWFARSTFGPGVPGGGPPLDAAGLAPATDLRPFLRGLGLPDGAVGASTEGELHEIGVLVRTLVQGVLQLHRMAASDPQPSRLASRPNPLAGVQDLQDVVLYLFGGHAASAGAMPPRRAVSETLDAVRERLSQGANCAGRGDQRD